MGQKLKYVLNGSEEMLENTVKIFIDESVIFISKVSTLEKLRKVECMYGLHSNILAFWPFRFKILEHL